MSRLDPDDENAAEKMRRIFGPTQIDHQIRQAIQFCWMALPKEKRNVDELERQIRRLVDRALRDCGRISMSFLGRGDGIGHGTDHHNCRSRPAWLARVQCRTPHDARLDIDRSFRGLLPPPHRWESRSWSNRAETQETNYSFVPFLGGIFGVLSLLFCPIHGARYFAWVPLILDLSFPMFLYAVFVLGAFRTHPKDGDRGEFDTSTRNCPNCGRENSIYTRVCPRAV